MPPKKAQPAKNAKKDNKKKDSKEQQIPQPIKEVRYEQLPENIKSNLENYKKLIGERTDLEIEEVVQTLINGIYPKEQIKQDELKQLITSEEVSNIFAAIKLGQRYEIKKQHIYSDIKPQNKLQFQIKRLNTKSQIKHPIPSSKLRYFCQTSIQELIHMIHLVKFEELFKNKYKYRTYSFLDRNYVQKLDPYRFALILNQYLSKNSQYLTGKINQDQLIALYYQNPPGRSLHYTDKVKLKQQGRFDYWGVEMNQKGGVMKRTRFMYPADNALLLEVIRKIGDDVVRDVVVERKRVKFGIKKNKSNNTGDLWLDIENFKVRVKNVPKQQLKIDVIQQLPEVKQEEKVQPVPQPPKPSPKKPELKKPQTKKATKKGEKIPQPQPEPQPQPIPEPVEPPPPPKPIQYTQTIQIQSSKYKYEIEQYITIYPKDKNSLQTYRQYGSHGQIIRHFKDKSITITYSSGNTSIFKSGSWKKVINHIEHVELQSQRALQTKTIQYQSSVITLRADSTVFIKNSTYDIIIFVEQTKYQINNKANSITITHPEYPTVRIRYDPHQIQNNNIIGQGTSYAYLGFDNLFERSYNGHIFELFSEYFSFYRYVQKVMENELEQPKQKQVTLVHFRQGSILKASINQVLFLSSQDLRNLQQIAPSEYWLQLFTSAQHRKQGIYTIDLVKSTIITTDNQGNYFKLSLSQPCIARPSVSLNINDQSQPQLPNQDGYYVNKQNYFLPTPVNFIPPRLFVVSSNDSIKQYLNQQSICDILRYKDIYNFSESRQQLGENKQYIQIFKNDKPNILKYMTHHHSATLDNQSVLPKILNSHTSTFISKTIPQVPKYQSRSFIKSPVFQDYQLYEQLIENYNKAEQLKATTQKNYRVLAKQDLY